MHKLPTKTMNNVYPIHVERSVPQPFKVINWKLHNLCNYSCSFCGKGNNSGNERWLSLAKYKSIVDKIAEACLETPFYIVFTGGEPTLYPDLIELLQYSKNKGAWNILISNGSRTMRWWTEFTKFDNILIRLILTYHTEQTDNYNNIADIMNLFLNFETETVCEVTHTKDNIPQAINAFNYLIKNTGGIIDIKGMNINEYDIYDLYSAEELSIIKHASYKPGILTNIKKKSPIPNEFRLGAALLVTNNLGITKNINVQQLMKNKWNKFLGWECQVGKDFLDINFQTINRSVCGVTGPIGHVDDLKYNFSNTSVICNKVTCGCFHDILTTKTKL